MASPESRLRWLARRTRQQPALVIVGLACAAAVLTEVGVFTGGFGLGHLLAGSSGSPGPNLNPDHQRILGVAASITYIGPISAYFPALQDTNLCGAACPELPKVWVPSQGSLPPEVGVYFYFNVTNLATVSVNLSVPILTTSGPDPTLFYLQTWCCWSKVGILYDELIDSPVGFTPGQQFGLEGYAYTTVPLPAVGTGGYDLNLTYTSN